MSNLTYYSCNYDTIWIFRIVLISMIFIMLVIKVIVYGDVYSYQNLCYPPAFFFGFVDSGRHSVYDLTHENFENQNESPLNLGKLVDTFPTYLKNMSNSVLLHIDSFGREQGINVWESILWGSSARKSSL